jgi:hypothetical protein
LTANFLKIKAVGGAIDYNYAYDALNNLTNSIDSIIQKGHCTADADCKTLTLASSYYCSLPVYKGYAADSVDMTQLLLNKHIYTELKDEMEYTPGGGFSICYIPQPHSSTCVENLCVLPDQ